MTPAELVHSLHDGGWSAAEIAATWATETAASTQPSGMRLPGLGIEAEAEAAR